MGANRLIAHLISLVILTKIVSAYLTTADEDLVLIDEGPGRWSGSTRKTFHFNDELFLDKLYLLFITVCYSIIFNGRRLSHRYIERSVSVISLDECKLLCTRETSFDCRSFNYRYHQWCSTKKKMSLNYVIVISSKTATIIDQLRSESRRLGQFRRHQQPRFLFRLRCGLLPACRSRSELLPTLRPSTIIPNISYFLLIVWKRILLRIDK
jgi:hypothetical protein